MRRNLLALDLLLLALCGLSVLRYSGLRRDRLAEERAFLQRRETAVFAPVVSMPPPVRPAAAGAYVQVAQQLLLSADRNPGVIVDVVPPKPMPPLPRAYGAMDFGGGPQVILAEKPGGRQRPYVPGDRIGEFEVLAFTRSGVVFGWDGKQVAASFEELKDTATAARVAQAAPPPPQAPASAAVQPQTQATKPTEIRAAASAGDVQGRPGPGDGPTRGCQRGDNSPAGTIAEGYRKVTIDMPMGNSCVWEKVQ